MEEGLLAAGITSSVFSMTPLLPGLGVMVPQPWAMGGGSPGPASRRNSNSLRHCDSLENVCDGPPFTEQLENGLGELAFQGLRFLSHSPEPLRYLEC
ncbi:uncharacterized protein LOC126992907 isoform X3 [Eriocheir sinensis]|uniref:uncharacterized protein LOC126992907 isoform X3 n=1 Tax=Eriocheir sinensis TaxID=95602 RepID=UPI0021C6A44A|nr:uncharacterized protein LOC126992907 isoform X3 [Eriocheir sinensis]